MSKKIFFISDIHGFYNEMIKSLQKAGFDENQDDHLLIVLGDIFDRGHEAVQVYNYLKRLMDNNKAVVTNGNHHEMFINFLKGVDLRPFNYLRNGLKETIADFWDRTAPFESWCLLEGQCEMNDINYAKWCKICRNNINKEYPELLPWLESLPNYFESKNYIGTHGRINGLCSDWKNPPEGWSKCHWDDGSFFGNKIYNTNKTVVIGHFGTEHLRNMYNIDKDKGKDEYDILVRDDNQIIAIDATTVLSKKVNVLMVEDELI